MKYSIKVKVILKVIQKELSPKMFTTIYNL